MDSGHADAALRACGTVLRRIHAAPREILDDGKDTGPVLVHGDFGPHNVLLDPVTLQVTAVVDWEFAHLGEPVEYLAWCEWIVRTHHPGQVDCLGPFFDAYSGAVPSWPVRQRVMLARCAALQEFCRRWQPDGPGVRLWEKRFQVTADWRE